MKSTGIVRKVDDLGRIVIPKELRHTHDIKVADPLEIFIDGNRIILQKYAPGCIICGQVNNVVHFGGKVVCKACIADIHDTMNEVQS